MNYPKKEFNTTYVVCIQNKKSNLIIIAFAKENALLFSPYLSSLF